MDNPVMIFGVGGIGKAALDIFKSNGILLYGFLDYEASLHGTQVDDVQVLGSPEDDGYLKYVGRKCEAFVALDHMKQRKSVVELLKTRRKVMPVNAIHQSAFISETATMKHGTFINAGVTVGAFAEIGNHCIIHTHATIDHEVRLDDFVQVGAGTVINAGVVIAEGTFVGSGVTIVSGVKVGKNANIGAGSVVIKDVKAKETVFGNPAQTV